MEPICSTTIPIQKFDIYLGECTFYAFPDNYIVIVKGNILLNTEPIYLRVHSQCLTGDLFGSLKCDCAEQLYLSFKIISQQKFGMIIYIPEHEGRGIGLVNKIKAYELQRKGENTIEANESLGLPVDARNYNKCKQILNYFQNLSGSLEKGQISGNNKTYILLTNNPIKIKELYDYILRTDPLITKTNTHNEKYIQTKKELMGHLF